MNFLNEDDDDDCAPGALGDHHVKKETNKSTKNDPIYDEDNMDNENNWVRVREH